MANGAGTSDDDDTDDIITLTDSDGEERDFECIGTIDVDGKDYALLSPVDADSDETDEIFVFLVEDSEDEASYEPVEDPEVLARIRAVVGSYLLEIRADEAPEEPPDDIVYS